MSPVGHQPDDLLDQILEDEYMTVVQELRTRDENTIDEAESADV